MKKRSRDAVYVDTLEVEIWREKYYQGLSGSFIIEEAYSGDKLHRLFGPARRVINEDNGQELAVEYFENGQHHRYLGPAVKLVSNDPPEVELEWWVDGKRHRWDEEGPAIQIINSKTGEVILEKYFYEGQEVDKENYPPFMSPT